MTLMNNMKINDNILPLFFILDPVVPCINFFFLFLKKTINIKEKRKKFCFMVQVPVFRVLSENNL